MKHRKSGGFDPTKCICGRNFTGRRWFWLHILTFGFYPHNPKTEFNLSRDALAQLIAAHTTGMKNAHPDDDDYGLADHFLHMIDTRYE